MSQFSRRARWLNVLFPASSAPRTADPGTVSDDVSLVQPYDGGAWPIPEASSWITLRDSPVGATGLTTIVTLGPDEVFRFFQMHAFNLIDPAANFQPQAVVPGSVPLTAAALSDSRATTGIAGTNVVPNNMNRAIVLPPGMRLQVSHFGGGVATQLRYVIYGCRAPAGSVFHC